MFVFNDLIGLWPKARPTGVFAGAAFLASVLACSSALAAGQLDGSYGVGGYFLDPPLADPRGEATAPVSEYTDVAIAEGGELFAVGFGSDDVCRVIAVNAAGERLAGWGGGTAVAIPCQGEFFRPAVAVQEDGQVVVASAGDWRVLQLRRWNAVGTPDASFGDGGVASIELPLVLWGKPKIQVAADGAIVVALAGRPGAGCPGHFCDDEPFRLAVVRLSPEGELTSARSDLPPPNPVWDPVLVGVAARPDGGVTAVVRGSALCDAGASCRYDEDSITLVYLASNGEVSTRTARWTAYYGSPVFEMDDATICVVDYDDDQGGWFLHRFDLAGERLGEPVGLGSVHGMVQAFQVLADGRLYVAELLHEPREDGSWTLRRRVHARQPNGQPETSFRPVGVDFGVSLDAGTLRVAPAAGVMVAAIGPGALGSVRLSLDAGNHPGRLGIVPRVTYAETGALVGQSNGESTTINQRDTTLEFAVDRTGGSEGAVSVSYRIDGNAAAARAFEPASGRLEWSAGELASKFVSLVLKAGSPVGEGARVELRLSEPTGGATIGSARHLVRVLEPSPGRLAFSGVNAEVTSFQEGQSAFIGVARRGGGNGSISVRVRRVYVTALGQPANPDDFSGPQEVVLGWADGETGTKAYDVGVRLDAIAEPREYFRVQLSDATGGAIIELASIDAAIDNVGGGSGGGSGGGNPPPASGGSGGGGALGLVALLALVLFSVATGTARRRRPLTRRSEG